MWRLCKLDSAIEISKLQKINKKQLDIKKSTDAPASLSELKNIVCLLNNLDLDLLHWDAGNKKGVFSNMFALIWTWLSGSFSFMSKYLSDVFLTHVLEDTKIYLKTWLMSRILIFWTKNTLQKVFNFLYMILLHLSARIIFITLLLRVLILTYFGILSDWHQRIKS